MNNEKYINIHVNEIEFTYLSLYLLSVYCIQIYIYMMLMYIYIYTYITDDDKNWIVLKQRDVSERDDLRNKFRHTYN